LGNPSSLLSNSPKFNRNAFFFLPHPAAHYQFLSWVLHFAPSSELHKGIALCAAKIPKWMHSFRLLSFRWLALVGWLKLGDKQPQAEQTTSHSFLLRSLGRHKSQKSRARRDDKAADSGTKKLLMQQSGMLQSAKC